MTPGAFAAGLLGALVCLAPRVAHADDEQAAPPDGGQDEWGSIIQRGKAQEQVIESDEERKRRTEAQKRLAAEDPAARARLQAERAAAKRQQEAAFQKRKGLRLLAYGGVGFGSYDAAMRVDEAKDDITFTSDTLSAMAGLGLRAAASPAVDFQLRAMFVVSGEGEGTYNCDGGEVRGLRHADHRRRRAPAARQSDGRARRARHARWHPAVPGWRGLLRCRRRSHSTARYWSRDPRR